MKIRETMAALKAAGTEQNRKVYRRHGVRGKMFGVSYAELGKLKKKIKTDQELAEKLWASGNHDARVLASMVADGDGIKSSQLDLWAKDLDSYVIADAFGGLVARTPFAASKRKAWSRSRSEFVAQAGWNLVTSLALKGEGVGNQVFEDYLKTIESKIGRAANRVRYSMNNALIAIGMRSTRLERKAIAVARRIGPVEVDHGETGCKTPEAVSYIRRVKERRLKRKAG